MFQRLARKKAVTIIELLVVTALIGILATVGSSVYSNQRKAARNAARRESLAGFQKGLESYYSATKTYLVHDGCDFTEMRTAVDKALDKNTTVAPADVVLNEAKDGGCLGYRGQGWGAVTRRFAPAAGTTEAKNPQYSSKSIADVLMQKGFMQTIQSDPQTRSYTDSLVANAENYNDFLLTLCKRDFTQAFLEEDAKVYGLFARLEPTMSTRDEKDEQQAQHLCGGPETPGGWEAVQRSGDVAEVGAE